MTREDYIEACGGEARAMDFETQALSIGREMLPSDARKVLDGAEPTAAYWSWLIEQHQAALEA